MKHRTVIVHMSSDLAQALLGPEDPAPPSFPDQGQQIFELSTTPEIEEGLAAPVTEFL